MSAWAQDGSKSSSVAKWGPGGMRMRGRWTPCNLCPGGSNFWKLVEDGGYEIRYAGDTVKPICCWYQKPADERYSAMA